MIDAQDPKLSNYAFGEIKDDPSRTEIEEAIKSSPELSALLAEIKETESILTEELLAEKSEGLSLAQRKKILAPQSAEISPNWFVEFYHKWLTLEHIAMAGSVCAILVVAIVFILRNSAIMKGTPTQLALNSSVNVLVAKERIVEGTQFEQFMLGTKPWDASDLPEGVIEANQMQEVVGKFAITDVMANMPILREAVGESDPYSNIPPGFRAIAITVDPKTVTNDLPDPNSRTDVLFSFKDGEKNKMMTLVKFAKVLAVHGIIPKSSERASIQGSPSVTLLVTEEDAKKIEFARNKGVLSLVSDYVVLEHYTSISASNILRTNNDHAADSTEKDPIQGEMYMKDPKTGKLVKYCIIKGKWRKSKSFSEE